MDKIFHNYVQKRLSHCVAVRSAKNRIVRWQIEMMKLKELRMKTSENYKLAITSSAITPM